MIDAKQDIADLKNRNDLHIQWGVESITENAYIVTEAKVFLNGIQIATFRRGSIAARALCEALGKNPDA